MGMGCMISQIPQTPILNQNQNQLPKKAASSCLRPDQPFPQTRFLRSSRGDRGSHPGIKLLPNPQFAVQLLSPQESHLSLLREELLRCLWERIDGCLVPDATV